MLDIAVRNPDELFIETLPEKYKSMVEILKENSAEITRATNVFQKAQSQTMDSLLTVTALTPIRNLRQMLAEMKRLKQALGEAYFKIEKNKIKIKQKTKDFESNTDELEKELLQVQIDELNWQNQNIMEGVSGAIRKLTSYTVQFKSLQEKHNLKGFTEADFEEEEEAYHISRACQQGLTAARSHFGVIDEGNMIYFQQLGINGAAIQRDMKDLLDKEQEIISKGGEPSHLLEVEWILNMVRKYKGCTKKFLLYRGQLTDPVNIAMEQ